MPLEDCASVVSDLDIYDVLDPDKLEVILAKHRPGVPLCQLVMLILLPLCCLLVILV